MPNVPVGVRRALTRLHPDTNRPSDLATALHRRSLSAARDLRGRVERAAPGRSEASLPVEPDTSTVPPTGTPPSARRFDGAHRASRIDQLKPSGRIRRGDISSYLAVGRERLRSVGGRVLGRERAIPLTVAGLVLVASIVSVVPATGIAGSTGDTHATPRIVIGGGVLDRGVGSLDLAAAEGATLADDDGAQHVLAAEYGQDDPVLVGPYLADGTLLKPVAVDTSVPDGADRLQSYRVKSGDTLTGIGHKFGISMMTIWWANKLTAKDDLHVGQQLVIPPVDGVVVKVAAGDTLDAIAARSKVDKAAIVQFNGLPDETVVIGQTLIVPGALGAAIATPTPKPVSRSSSTPRSSSGSSSTASAPKSYSGGRFYFPVPGHRINQYYRYGHRGIDIDGNTGDRIYAAAKGTVIYAGWKNNGGGYVVWVSHGSGLYTTYNHLSAVLVHRGQAVARGQVIARMGATGFATGSHLHFEVWKGGAPLWPDRRVNPMKYF